MEAPPEAVTRDAGVATESSDRGRGGDRTRVSNALLLPPGAGKMTSCVSGSQDRGGSFTERRAHPACLLREPGAARGHARSQSSASDSRRPAPLLREGRRWRTAGYQGDGGHPGEK